MYFHLQQAMDSGLRRNNICINHSFGVVNKILQVFVINRRRNTHIFQVKSWPNKHHPKLSKSSSHPSTMNRDYVLYWNSTAQEISYLTCPQVDRESVSTPIMTWSNSLRPLAFLRTYHFHQSGSLANSFHAINRGQYL